MKEKEVGMKDFAYGSMILMISNIVLKAANFLFLPLYTKYLAPAEMGISDTITNFTAFVLPLLVCGFDSAFGVFYFDKNDSQRYKKVFNTVQITMMRVSLVLIIFGLCARPLSTFLFGNKEYVTAIIISLFGVALSLWMLAFSLHIRMQNRMGVMGIISIVTSLVMLILNIVFVVYMKMGYMSLIVSSTLAHMLQLVLYVFFGKIKIERSYYDNELFKEMLKYALPMLPIAIVNWILALSDRYVILYFWNEEAVGLYGIANRFVTVLNVVTSSITMAFTTFAFSNAQKSDAKDKYVKVLSYVYLILIFAVFTISVFAKPVIELMTEASYYESYLLLQPLLFGQLGYCVSSIIGYGFAHAHKSKYFLVPSTIAMLINVILNFVFVPEYGAYAASLTTLTGYLAMMYVTYILSDRIYPCPYEIGKITISLFAGYGLAWVARDSSVWLQIVIWVVGICGLGIVFRKSLAEIFRIFIRIKKKFIK